MTANKLSFNWKFLHCFIIHTQGESLIWKNEITASLFEIKKNKNDCDGLGSWAAHFLNIFRYTGWLRNAWRIKVTLFLMGHTVFYCRFRFSLRVDFINASLSESSGNDYRDMGCSKSRFSSSGFFVSKLFIIGQNG